MTDQVSELSRLARAARWTEVRVRLDAVVQRAVAWLPLPIVYAAGALTYVKVAWPAPSAQRALLLGGIVPVAIWLGAVLVAGLRRRPPRLGALLLDRYHGYNDRVTTAL